MLRPLSRSELPAVRAASRRLLRTAAPVVVVTSVQQPPTARPFSTTTPRPLPTHPHPSPQAPTAYTQVELPPASAVVENSAQRARELADLFNQPGSYDRLLSLESGEIQHLLAEAKLDSISPETCQHILAVAVEYVRLQVEAAWETDFNTDPVTPERTASDHPLLDEIWGLVEKQPMALLVLSRFVSRTPVGSMVGVPLLKCFAERVQSRFARFSYHRRLLGLPPEIFPDATRGLAGLLELAQEEFPPALVLVGQVLVNSGIQIDKAIQGFELAAAKGSTDAITELGEMYWLGKGVDRDPAKALPYFEKAAAKDHPKATYYTACIYHAGLTTLDRKPDYAKAYQFFNKAADRGIKEARHNLATMYLNGEEVPQSDTLAFENYLIAARMGFPQAMINVAKMYIAGRGVGKDLAAAKLWFTTVGRVDARLEKQVAPLLAEIDQQLSMSRCSIM
ncbi:hypothetical protein H4R33_006342 [Dimargaris cristalligena]|nr:hypothetical protein H4R33_006342 [Dimargaris cristalligena]